METSRCQSADDIVRGGCQKTPTIETRPPSTRGRGGLEKGRGGGGGGEVSSCQCIMEEGLTGAIDGERGSGGGRILERDRLDLVDWSGGESAEKVLGMKTGECILHVVCIHRSRIVTEVVSE